jgi:2-dehydro-3-deoxyphosphogluconate aldolase/(4S)-4-hydroxy-2-oxoglutarate aldolase
VNDILDLLDGHRVIPVVVIDDLAHAEPLADALIEGQLPLAEVTFRTAAAADVVRAMAGRPDLVVGAGSIRTADQVNLAFAAGARFIVSPGLSDSVVARCHALEVPVLPGVATPTEIMRALDLGVEVVKLFPAGLLGGPAAVRDLAAPFPGLRFVPTGGVGPGNLADYLSLRAVAAVGGSWMVARDLLHAGRFDEIGRLTAAAVAACAAVAQ